MNRRPRITPISPGSSPAAPGPLIGAHMSIAGGLDKAIGRALAVRARVLQIFTRNTHQWKARRLGPSEIEAFRNGWAASGLHTVVAHDCYLINLASPAEALRRRSVETLAEELLRCGALGIPFLVTHPGAHMGAGFLEGCRRAAESLDEARAIAPAPSVTVLLETVAGQGTTVGRSFEELARIRDRVSAPGLVQFCADTCHIHAAGYDIVTERGYERTLQEFDDILGLTNLRAIHFNDSKTERGSRVDRHQHIGKGHLGARTFQRMLRDPRLRAIPKILELPKGKDGVVMDRRNLGLLRRLSEKALPRGRTSG
ncbi:MAG: deoxyribonuclease IV [Candidatus Eisenbacteria bacterium]|uniref:Probable endonuclease 4 n=1 Tax=Eiseniibacteriota bacterium TaxID=2212470 RepID=A0A538SJ72_UNCEI|nr:MAG: deoxyribonuclease IV [Candidatus Eisenbacteria bacterium]